MAVIIDGKVYRNLQEQVLANTRNIENITKDKSKMAIYVHKISWKYMTDTPNVYLSYLSTKSTPYSSMADIFSHKNETSLSLSEVAEYEEGSAIVKFRPTGAIKSAVAIEVVKGEVDTFAMAAGAFSFVKDEVISDWGA